MNKKNRTLLQVKLPEEFKERNDTNLMVSDLMGKNPEKRFEFIRDNAHFAKDKVDV